jgi:nucleotide-binding universal stress UspA family protein
MKRILVTYDGSTSSAKAFSLGVELSEKYGAELMVLAACAATRVRHGGGNRSRD